MVGAIFRPETVTSSKAQEIHKRERRPAHCPVSIVLQTRSNRMMQATVEIPFVQSAVLIFQGYKGFRLLQASNN
jgi:hypothetical protein